MEHQPEIEPQDPDHQPDEAEAGAQEETSPLEETKSTGRPRSAEDALREVRQSLREEEEKKKQEKKPGLLARLLGRWKGSAAERQAGEEQGVMGIPLQEELPGRMESPLPESELPAPAAEPPAAPAPEAPPAPEAVHTERTPVIPEPVSTEPSTPVRESAPYGNFRKELFTEEQEGEPEGAHHSILTRLHSDEVESGETRDLRREALEDYAQEPEAEAVEPQLPLRQRLRRTWRDMRPLEKRMLTGSLVIIGIMLILGMVVVTVPALLPKAPPATPTASTAPYPISIGLPGGWVFPLNRGKVEDGRWDPARAEWLAGTEISRWVALPWSVQLEAVFRTLKLDDTITLFMSNNDSLVYKVKRVEQIPVDQISHLESKQPSLLLILSKQDSSSRWVVSAVP